MIGCFFYIIETAHYIKYGDMFVQLLGYGITINPKKRSKQYSDHSGVEQEFGYLFFGPIQHIKALESIIKQRVASKTHKIYGEPVEWISPKAKMSVKDMLTLVNDTIDNRVSILNLLRKNFFPLIT